MLEFLILIAILSLLQKITIGEKMVVTDAPEQSKDDAWSFDNIDDAMEFRELRATGWNGNAKDFYKWRDE